MSTNPKPTNNEPAGTTLRINFRPSEFLQAYISTYPNVKGIVEITDTYIVVYTTMTSAQIRTFKDEVFARVIEVV